MPNIKEIALNIADKSGAVAYSPAPLRAVRGYSFTFEQLQNFAEALIAEIAKGNEPVAFTNSCELDYLDFKRADSGLVSAAMWKDYDKDSDIALYTLPPTASQIEQETAEAWQPIETAPKCSSTVILGFDPSWYDIATPMFWSEKRLNWRFYQIDEEIRPTHWMPLPTPPKRSMEGV